MGKVQQAHKGGKGGKGGKDSKGGSVQTQQLRDKLVTAMVIAKLQGNTAGLPLHSHLFGGRTGEPCACAAEKERFEEISAADVYCSECRLAGCNVSAQWSTPCYMAESRLSTRREMNNGTQR